MGATCNRLDCALVVEECTTSKGIAKRSVWYDCAGDGEQIPRNGSSSDYYGGDLDDSDIISAQVACDKFSIRRTAKRGGNDWRRRYILGRELGSGQTAVVFEACAAADTVEEMPPPQLAKALEDARGKTQSAASMGVQGPPGPPPRGARGRKVALKKFDSAGSLMFQQELKSLTAIGVHPHILRLLESFEGGSEDVLILEHCDGGDLYELYAANNGCCMLETFVVHLIRQLLLALQHLVDRGVEHRDVKPENLLLYGAPAESATGPFKHLASGAVGQAPRVPQLKLADFGWAVILPPSGQRSSVPPEGVGSLWYAPPELNPPVPGLPVKGRSSPPLGRSDMWSVGIIAYLLLIGHSPFNMALRAKDPATRETEVIRLAALGQLNTAARAWSQISEEARSFIIALIQPEPGKRLSPMEAWAHPFIARLEAPRAEDAQARLSSGPFAAGRGAVWRRLDDFQHLCWLALARALGEPEVAEARVFSSFIDQQIIGNAMYLENLAEELALLSTPAWFLPQTAWSDVLSLAFRYLDADADGVLNAQDLMEHILGEDAQESARKWLSTWRNGQDGDRKHTSQGLSFNDFRWALCASYFRDQVCVENGVPLVKDVELESRMQAIDDVCQRFLDEEFDDHGFGF